VSTTGPDPDGLAAVDPVLVEQIAGNLDALRRRIAAVGRDDVTVVGVTKRHPVAVVRAAAALGLVELGENYAQELVAKAQETVDLDLRWHFIGQLQSNKVRSLVGHVRVIETLDRPSLAREVGKRLPGVTALVQVDLAGIPGRGGCAWDEVDDVVAAAQEAGVAVTGLMGVAPPMDGSGGPAAVRAAFERLAATGQRLGLVELSMGMSADLDEALASGATEVRIGTALFGGRTL
jgi:pyridoxal phosphate enzyme (YggS family)